MAISGIGGISTWRDAAEYMALGAGNVQVCTAAMVYGFKIVEDMIDGLAQLDGQQGLSRRRRHSPPGRAELRVVEVPEPQLHRQGADRPVAMHPVRTLPYRLRRHLASGDHARKEWRTAFRSDRRANASGAICVSRSARSSNASPCRHLPVGSIDTRTGIASAAMRIGKAHPNNPASAAAAVAVVAK